MRRRTGGVIAAGLLCAIVAIALGACGSRTGLLVDEPQFLRDEPDASRRPNASRQPNATRPRDATPPRDAARDAAIETLPPIEVRPRPSVQRMDCPNPDATLVYVVTDGFDIYSFNPADATFRLIGRLTCPAPAGSTPFSMAVDRKGKAYVVFADQQGGGAGDGLLFQVSTATGACVPTSYGRHQLGVRTFGMGFASNDTGPGETLYIASNTALSASEVGIAMTPSQLGTIDTNTWTLGLVGPFVPSIANGELTGTGDGRLFAFYTINDRRDSAIGQIDKQTGRVIAESPLIGVPQGTGWAFAFWGGDFYTFTAPNDASIVTRFRPSDNSVTTVGSLDKKIVGAGVSTCAPE